MIEGVLMRTLRWAAATASLIFALTLVAQNYNYNPDPSWKAPASAARKKNPVPDTPKTISDGRQVYQAHCWMCHGMNGEGMANSANFHVSAVQKQSDGTLFWKITTGHQQKGMPSFQGLPERQRWELVHFLRTFKGKGA